MPHPTPARAPEGVKQLRWGARRHQSLRSKARSFPAVRSQAKRPQSDEAHVKRSDTGRPKVLRVLAFIAGLVLVAPIAAHAEPLSRDLTVTVKVGSPMNNVPLPGARVSVYALDNPEALAQGATTPDGSVELTVGGDEVALEVQVAWHGAPTELRRTVPHSLNGEGVEIILDSDFGYLDGYINAKVGEESLSELSGSSVEILRAGVVVETIALSASGEFLSGVLPVFGDDFYELRFVPPVGYTLAAEQQVENAPIEHPGEGVTLTVERYFDLVEENAGGGDPEPGDGSGSGGGSGNGSDGNGGGKPSKPGEMLPTIAAFLPQGRELGNIPGLNFQLPRNLLGPDASAADLGALLGDISSDDLADLLSAVRDANGLLFLTDEQNRVRGLVFPSQDREDLLELLRKTMPSPQLPGHLSAEGLSSAGSLMAAVSVAVSPLSRTVAVNGYNSVSMGGVDLAAMDIESALLLIQTQRASLLESQLANQLREINERNQSLAALNEASASLRVYLAERTSAAHDEAVKALKDLGIDVSKFELVPDKGVLDAEGERLLGVVVERVDGQSNTQQMDMLRLQSLSNKQNEAFDVMTNFVKKMQDSRSAIVGNMRSEPTPIGSVVWDRGNVEGSFDLSRVKPGDHHAILNFEDFGTTLIAEVEVKGPELADTGWALVPMVLGGASLGMFGLILILGSESRRRRLSSV